MTDNIGTEVQKEKEAVDIEDNMHSKEGIYYADMLILTENEDVANSNDVMERISDLLSNFCEIAVVLNVRPGNKEEIQEWRYNLYDEEDLE